MHSFHAKIQLIGVNPYVLLPDAVLKALFVEAGRDKGPVPVKGKLDGHPFVQTLVRYSGKWRLYLNTPMRKAAKKDVGDKIEVEIAYDPAERVLKMHPSLEEALNSNPEARKVFDSSPPSRRKEIIRYIGFLKSEEARARNVSRAIQFLLGKERFVGRDKP